MKHGSNELKKLLKRFKNMSNKDYLALYNESLRREKVNIINTGAKMIKNEWIEKVKSEKDYKKFIGKADDYDIIGALQFNILTSLGLRATDKVLDVGCGALRLGRLLITYLNKNNYYGLEPEQWLVTNAIDKEVSHGLIELKKPVFEYNENFKTTGIDFDYVICNSVFIHASLEQIKSAIRNIEKAMKPNAKFIFNFIVDKKDNDKTDWSYPSHVKYTIKTIEKLLKKFNVTYKNWEYPGLQQWVLCTKK